MRIYIFPFEVGDGKSSPGETVRETALTTALFVNFAETPLHLSKLGLGARTGTGILVGKIFILISGLVSLGNVLSIMALGI